MYKNLVVAAVCLVSAAKAAAGTYSVHSVSVTHVGGWPSASVRGTTAYGYGSDGGAVPSSPYKDGFYKMDAVFELAAFASVPSVVPIVMILDRNNISVQYTIQFVASGPGDTPGSATGAADTRYWLSAWNIVNGSTAYMSNTSAAGVLTGPGPTYGWHNCLALVNGSGTSLVEDPGPYGSWNIYATKTVPFGSWTLVSPGVWQATGEVDYANATSEFDLKSENHGASELVRSYGYTAGEWQFRLETVTVGGVNVISQPGF